MKKVLFLLALLLVAAPAFAQYQEFTLLYGAAKRQVSSSDKEESNLTGQNYDLRGPVREISYGVQLEPGTVFRIRGGAMDSAVRFHNPDYTGNAPSGSNCTADPQHYCRNLPFVDGTIDHIDALVDYRFSEAWGTTGIFAGFGLYRQRGTSPTSYATAAPTATLDETKYGFSVGTDTIFPITRTFGIVAEGSYHWMQFRDKARVLTLGAGIRFAF